jgi:hypothetical protein
MNNTIYVNFKSKKKISFLKYWILRTLSFTKDRELQADPILEDQVLAEKSINDKICLTRVIVNKSYQYCISMFNEDFYIPEDEIKEVLTLAMSLSEVQPTTQEQTITQRIVPQVVNVDFVKRTYECERITYNETKVILPEQIYKTTKSGHFRMISTYFPNQQLPVIVIRNMRHSDKSICLKHPSLKSLYSGWLEMSQNDEQTNMVNFQKRVLTQTTTTNGHTSA